MLSTLIGEVTLIAPAPVASKIAPSPVALFQAPVDQFGWVRFQLRLPDPLVQVTSAARSGVPTRAAMVSKQAMPAASVRDNPTGEDVCMGRIVPDSRRVENGTLVHETFVVPPSRAGLFGIVPTPASEVA